MNLKTAARRLSVHYQTAYKLVRSGALPAVKIGGTYEVSEAAIERYERERYDLRRGIETLPEAAAPSGDRDVALAAVRAAAGMSTKTVRAVYDTIVQVAAEALGDMCVVAAADVGEFRPVAFHDTNARRRAVLAAMLHDRGFGEHGPLGAMAQVRGTHRTVLITHVPQDQLRASIGLPHRQFLDVAGVHSLIAVPVAIDGKVEAVIGLVRAAPGAPYGHDDVAFVEALADALQLAMRRVAAFRAGWERRGTLVEAIGDQLREGRDIADIADLLAETHLSEIVFDISADEANLSATNNPAALPTAQFAPTAGSGDREPEFNDVECDIVLVDGTAQKFNVHRAMVRDDTGRARAFVVVAQPTPHHIALPATPACVDRRIDPAFLQALQAT